MNAIKLGQQWFDYADVLIDVMIGYACNVQCDYCSVTDEMRQENMTIAAVMAQLRDARARGATTVAFGGGEPTIRRGLLPLVRWCRDRGFTSIKIPSNGLMYSYPAYAKEASEAGITDFHLSLMAHTDALYERIMGKPPVPTLALWSRRDGIVAPSAARGMAHEVDKAVEIDTHHMGFAVYRPALSRVVQEIRIFLTEVEGKAPVMGRAVA